jgi:hypothetical protein
VFGLNPDAVFVVASFPDYSRRGSLSTDVKQTVSLRWLVATDLECPGNQPQTNSLLYRWLVATDLECPRNQPQTNSLLYKRWLARSLNAIRDGQYGKLLHLQITERFEIVPRRSRSGANEAAMHFAQALKPKCCD